MNHGIALSLTLLTLSAVRAQDPPTPPLSLGESVGVAVVDGQLGAAGPSYKATFDQNGIAFTPALGEDAPRSYPLRFTLQSIWRGDRELLRASGRVTPRHDGNTIRYAHTPEISERYEARPAGIEQSFAFGRPLPGAGDLVVRGRITTDLVATYEGECTDGFSFDSGAWGGVSIGAVTGIDARGDRAAGTLRLHGDSLELVLPADFVDRARYPLVLDPLIGSLLAINNSTGTDTRPDVAYDDTHDVFLVVWERYSSFGDQDVLAQRVRPDGSLVGGLIQITNNTHTSGRPSVGSVSADNQFLVAWADADGSDWDVLARSVDASDGSTSGKVTIAGSSVNEWHIDVGGNLRPNSGDTRAVIVWEAYGLGIRGRFVSVPAGNDPIPLGFGQTHFDITTDSRDSYPAVPKSPAGFAQSFPVVWQRAGAVGLVRAAYVDSSGNLLDPLLKLGTTNFHRNNPDIEGHGTDFMVVYDREETNGSVFRDVYCRMIRWDGSALVQTVGETPVAAAASVSEYGPRVAFGESKYFVFYQRGNSIKYLTMDAQGCVPCRPVGDAFTGTSSTWAETPACATLRSGTTTPADDLALAVFRQGTWLGGGGAEFDISGQLLEETGPGGPITNLGGGCGGGNASANGAFALGNASFSFDLDGAPASATAAFLNFNLPQPPIQCSTFCAVTPPFIFVPAALAAGSASVPLVLPCDTSILNGDLEVQWWVLGGPTAPCLPFGLTVSNRLHATLGL